MEASGQLHDVRDLAALPTTTTTTGNNNNNNNSNVT
jgi:hypothetical protein